MIKVTEDYYIEPLIRPTQFVLKHRYMSKPRDGGEPTERFAVDGYYTTIRGALRGLAKQVSAEIIAEGSYSLSDALNRISEEWDRLCQKIDGATPWEEEVGKKKNI